MGMPLLPLAVVLLAASTAQDVAQLPPASADAAVIDLVTDKTERMTIPVSIGDSGPYPFLIDTGADRTVISRELATELGLSDAGRALLHSMSGSESVALVRIPSLRFSAGGTDQIRAPALARVNLGAHGLIGLDTLRNRRVLLDFRTNTMTVTPAEKRGVRHDPDEIVVTARRKGGQLILVGATINGRKVDVVIDTGAQVSVGNYALRNMLRRSRDQTARPIELISVTGGKTLAEHTSLREVRLGSVVIKEMPIAFADAHAFRALGLTGKPALMLGMDALRLFDRVSVDFANRNVRFLLRDEARRDDRRYAETHLPRNPAA